MRPDSAPQRPARRPGRVVGVIAAAILFAACDPAETPSAATGTSAPGGTGTSVPVTGPGATPSTPTTLVPVPREIVDGFDDHTVSRIASVAEFDALARVGVAGQTVVKFSIPEMTTSDDVRWLDSNFYALHDEWYWFRLLNGHTVPGFDTEPVRGTEFATVADIIEWAAGRDAAELPLDLQFIESRTHGQRLYSPMFYRVAMPDGARNYGLGSVIHFPNAADGREHWLIELEFSDVPTPAEVDRYFDLLSSTLPNEIADRLEWVLRSPEQEAVAQRMIDDRLARHDRVVRYDELVEPGQTTVYNPGIAAGRLLVVDGVNVQLNEAGPTDIVLVEHVPDWLPPAAAIITGAPQTPLAHVNLLARNRGIPNASRSGLLDDPGVRQAARVSAFAVVRATDGGDLDIVLISREQYDQWRGLDQLVPVAVPTVDRASLPTLIDLTELTDTIGSDADIDRWRPIIGGKSAGFLTLMAAPNVTAPPNPQAITVAPYLDHLATLDTELTAMLADPDFRRSARARFLFLEGLDDYLVAFPAAFDQTYAGDLLDRHATGTPLARVLAAGGFRRLFRSTPIDPDTLARITAGLDVAFADQSPTQGLRFRSSSSVEDIEGFSGAGLYDSNTGFLDPIAVGVDPALTIERAILRTWSSYWGFEAFEERELERIDHRSGAMGVLVHARFDDDLEIDNGVATFTLLPGRYDFEFEAAINVQLGAASVTNPDPLSGDLPEVIDVRGGNGDLVIERLAASTIAGGPVMTDAAIAELIAQMDSVARLWRDRVNRSLAVEQRVETVTLDFEFKTVRSGWPALREGDPLPSRLVLKQARSLDPGLRRIPAIVRALPIPRDVLARASQITASCDGVDILTDPFIAPDLGYGTTPLHIDIDIDAADDCTERTLYATPDQFLVDLLDSDSLLSEIE